MVINLAKCHYLIINKDLANKSVKLDNKTLDAKPEQKLLGITIDKDLNFQSKKFSKIDYRILQIFLRYFDYYNERSFYKNIS